jgi:uncharacterized membrane protein
MLLQAQTVSVSTTVAAAVVYAFARQMDRLPEWASGLAAGIEERDGRWIAQSPMGEVQIAMAAHNAFGVLDHDVTMSDGTCVHNAFRVTPAGSGSVVTFVVLRAPGVSDETFAADVAHVQDDLRTLCRLLEDAPSAGAS